MMFLKGCALIYILSLWNLILCDTEKFHNGNNNTNDTERFTNETSTTMNGSQNSTGTRVKLKNGRYATEHFPVTEDGYILKLFRLYSKSPSKLRPVLLVHGLFQSSDRFLHQNKSQSLAYILQELGYDVWLFNARGNKHSRGHVQLDPETNKTEFFNYSFEEIGRFDLATTVDYILTVSSFKKLHYIGHSLGGTFFLVLNSLVTRYNDKFDRAFLMAPLAYHKSFPNERLQKEFEDPSRLYEELVEAGTVEIFPYDTTKKNMELIPKKCLGEETWEKVCNELKVQTIMGLSSDNNTILDTRGGSIKTLIHWAQNVKDKKFRRWDFGKNHNDREYSFGRSPPEYRIEDITVLTKLIYSPYDGMVNDTDIEELAKMIKTASTRKVESQNFTHDDFVSGKNVMEDVYNDIIEDLPESLMKLVKKKKIAKNNSEEENSDGENSDEKEKVPVPWSALISVIGLLLFLCLRIASCCKDRNKDKNTDNKNTTQGDSSNIQGNPSSIQDDLSNVQDAPSNIQDDPSNIKDNLSNIQVDPSNIQDDSSNIQEHIYNS